jgi:UPF0755 protein
MRRTLAFLSVLLLLGALAAGGVYWWTNDVFTSPGPHEESARVEVPKGASVRSVVNRLAERGLVSKPRVVLMYLRVRGEHPKIKAGTYEIPPHASPARVFSMLERGEVVMEQLTVVEGSTFAELRRQLEKHPAVVATLRGKTDAEVMAAIGHPGEHPEGRFFPDTYRFAAGTTDVEILKLAYNSMERLLAQAWERRKPDLPINTPYEALILASIVEKETGVAQDRPQIAGVFTKRLKIGMRLQTDPTVIYGLGDKFDGDIRSRDLTTDTPYNTYTRAGLPPTPIALPGRDSVFAAVQPDETGALFFVATGDGTGSHYFSRTLEEHNQAVRRYLARLRQQRASQSGSQTSAPSRDSAARAESAGRVGASGDNVPAQVGGDSR